MDFHFPVNNFRAMLGAPLTPASREIVLDTGGGGALRQMPCFVSVEDEIIDVRERRRAQAETGSEGTDRITWTAVRDGAAGNAVSITLAHPGTGNAPLSVSVSGSAAVIQLATDASGNLISTVSELLVAVGAHIAASGLLIAASQDAGVVAPAPETVLSGGDDDRLAVLETAGGRGAQGTSPASHPAGASVEVRYTAEHLLELQAAAGIQMLHPGQFAVMSGAPSLEVVQLGASAGHNARAWKFGPGADSAVSLLFLLFPSFRGRRLQLALFWYCKSATAGDCRWTVRGKAMNWMFGPAAIGQAEAGATAISGAPGLEQITACGLDLELPGTRLGEGPFSLVVARDGAAAEDTFPGDAWLVGAAMMEGE